jgi:hypothetical protein
VIGFIIGVVLVILAGDALRSRLKLKLRQRHPSPTAPHQLVGASGSGAWRSLTEDAHERSETEPEAANPFGRIDQILAGNARRGPRR